MASIRWEGPDITIETDCLLATVATEGYVSGVKAGTLLDKQTGAFDLGFGLDIVDFLLEPLADDGQSGASHDYAGDVMLHGHMPKRYVELPQICTQARWSNAQTYQGKGFVAVKLWWRYTEATYGRRPGSLWEQHIVFPDGQRYFFAADRITSANTVQDLILRIDMPGHLKHTGGDSFEQIYLSYEGYLPGTEFLEDFAPDARFLYQRDNAHIPERMIRAYQVTLEGRPGPWLAGMTLQPAAVSAAWCHQRGYVCFIQEIGQWPVAAGESFGAAYVIGWFDDLREMQAVYDRHKGAGGIRLQGAPDAVRWEWTD
ncbi:MAG: hypothetical protein HPY69_01985 [Armatimonadetes bacterium]|nr:hypothetical protein [Armatimonadota bacterium]